MGILLIITLTEIQTAEEYVREYIPSKVLGNADFGSEIEAMFVKINIRKIKWLISCSYNPHKADIKTHLKALGKNLDLQS